MKKTMGSLRLQLRFLVPLALCLAAGAWLALPLMDHLTLRWHARDLNLRGAVLTSALSDSIAAGDAQANGARLQALFERTAQDERLLAIALCDADGRIVRRTAAYPAALSCPEAGRISASADPQLTTAGGPVHVGVHAVQDAGGRAATVVLLHDLSFIALRSQDTRRYLIALIVALGLLIAMVTMVVAQLSWRGWVAGTRALLRGEGLVRPLFAGRPELAPLAGEVKLRLREIEEEYRRSLGPAVDWGPERLRTLVQTQLRGAQILVVSNREPYIHDMADGQIVVRQPASGLVTAVEPVMRACSGSWIAHGAGSADRKVVDAHDCVAVPPGVGDYTLRRVWLTPEEEQGYYYGFANEGLWPLCHVAHVRPVFREGDWEHYRRVNERFADAVASQAQGDDPVVLIQDYHFALLPALIRARLPRATIVTFWHIPWPNPESFGICPWRRELLQGLLGSDILGFHTPFHGRNFMESVDRFLEARIETEHSSITYQDVDTRVQAYPISIEWPAPEVAARRPPVVQCRQRVFERLGLAPDDRLAVGVDRFDYTKGIFERLMAVERLLEKQPQWIGRFTFAQIAAPSRSSLEEYRNFQDRIGRLVDRINGRFGRDGYCPVRLLAEHLEHDAIVEFYRAADACVVTSLHDGMNLVSKEFISARDDERGVLILSRFAGAARELTEALVVNPYHLEECADALASALSMSDAEQRERMASLRATVREFNVHRWAGRMLADAASLRQRARIQERVRQLHEGGQA